MELGWVSAIDPEGRTIWIVDAHRDDGKRFVVRADEKLTAFIELEATMQALPGLELDHGLSGTSFIASWRTASE
jgi:hypothetical protein